MLVVVCSFDDLRCRSKARLRMVWRWTARAALWRRLCAVTCFLAGIFSRVVGTFWIHVPVVFVFFVCSLKAPTEGRILVDLVYSLWRCSAHLFSWFLLLWSDQYWNIWLTFSSRLNLLWIHLFASVLLLQTVYSNQRRRQVSAGVTGVAECCAHLCFPREFLRLSTFQSFHQCRFAGWCPIVLREIGTGML